VTGQNQAATESPGLEGECVCMWSEGEEVRGEGSGRVDQAGMGRLGQGGFGLLN
jgi:hypothetical protein